MFPEESCIVRRVLFFVALCLTASSFAQSNAAAEPLRNLRFRNLGPTVAGGRVTAVAGIPGDPHIYYAGTAAGGIFKSEDAGISWRPIFEHEAVATIGALALAPSNPNIIWVGTGEANLRNDVSTGRGVYYSPDGGNTWRHTGLDEAGQISSVIVDPKNPDTVLVGAVGHAWGPNAERGVFRTADGGKSWQKVLYVNDSTGVSDMIMDPRNPLVIYAGMWQIMRHPWEMISGGESSGIYKSIDGGLTWRKLTDGVPAPPVGRVGLAIAPTNPRHLYAFIESKNGILWESRDAGERWTKVSDNWLLNARPWYFGKLAVSPGNEDKLYFMSFDLLSSNDGGHTARIIGRGVHADHHAIWIDPQDSSRIIEGNDGGVYFSMNGGESWRMSDSLPIEQFYSVALDDRFPYTICGGLQDNSAWCGPAFSLGRGNIENSEWWTVIEGDGQYAVPGPKTNLVYADSQNGVIDVVDRETGARRRIRPYLLTVEEIKQSDLKYRFNWTSPITTSPTDGKEVFVGGNVLFRSGDAGATWQAISPDLTRNDKSKQVLSGGPIENDLSGAESYDTILSLSISRTNPQVIWVGTDDGVVQTTRDGGQHWQNVTPKGVTEWGRVEQIDASPFSPESAFVSVDFHETDNNRPYVFKTHDGGTSWQDISAGLPSSDPVHVVREDPSRKGLLIAGTDSGLFYSLNEGGSWSPLTAGFPTVPVYDLKFQPATHDLVVATHGRGMFILDDITALEQMTPATMNTDLQLFDEQPAFRASMFNRYGRSSSTHAAEFSAQNRPLGAFIQYWVKQNSESAPGAQRSSAQITITGPQGEIVRKLNGPARAGINRVAWDLAYDPAPRPRFLGDTVDSEIAQSAGGPPVIPGTYKVTVKFGDQTQTKTIEVRPDPRFPADLKAIQAQTTLALEVRDATAHLVQSLNRAAGIHEQIATMQKTLASDADPRHAALLQQAKAIDQKVSAWSDPLFNPAIQNDSKYYLHYLARLYDRLTRLMNIITVDYAQAPGPAASEEAAELQKQVDESVRSFNSLVNTDLAAFNRQAAETGAATIYAGADRRAGE
jgi:photosystem II stability/assembly factor-like uncharacterized protein